MPWHTPLACASVLNDLDDTAPHSWGNRRANGYQALAVDGYLILAERLRTPEERAVVRSVLERVMRVTLDMDAVYAADAASAQAVLQQRLSEDTPHEFAVRPPLPPPALSSLSSARLWRACVVRRRERDANQRVRIHTCGDLRKKTKAEITESDSRFGKHTHRACPWL